MPDGKLPRDALFTQRLGLPKGGVNIPDPAATLDKAGRIASINGPWRLAPVDHPYLGGRADTGIDYAALCEKPLPDGSVPGAELARGIREVLSGRTEPQVITYSVPRDGRSTEYRATVQPLTGLRDMVVMITHHNHTEGILAEDRLKESARMLRALFDRSSDAFTVQDMQGRYLMVNPVGLQLMQRKAQEVLGRTPQELFGPEAAAEFNRLMQQVTGSGAPLAIERPWTIADQTLVIHMTMLPYVSESGEMRGIISICRNVSKERALEEQLRQSQKMEAIGRLAGGIAHDFNNILMAITGYTDLVAGALPPDSPLRPDVNEIRSSADRATALTRQLLAFGRRQILKPEVVDLNALMRDLHPMLKRLIGENIEVVLDLAAKTANVQADRSQLEQVVMNLAINSRDAMPNGGRLTLRTGGPGPTGELQRELQGLEAGRQVTLEVSDTGIGMDEEMLSHLFEPFFTTKGQGKGTGLGLPTVYGIVHQSGGRISVKSSPGQGTAFIIYLPEAAAPLKEPKRPSTSHVARPKGTGTILLLEDADSVRSLVKRVLSEQGYNVLTAAEGDEAIRIARAQKIDLLVTDVVLPRQNGIDIARQIRESNRATKVIFMTGYTESGVIRRHAISGSTPVLQKPFKAKELLAKVQELLGS